MRERWHDENSHADWCWCWCWCTLYARRLILDRAYLSVRIYYGDFIPYPLEARKRRITTINNVRPGFLDIIVFLPVISKIKISIVHTKTRSPARYTPESPASKEPDTRKKKSTCELIARSVVHGTRERLLGAARERAEHGGPLGRCFGGHSSSSPCSRSLVIMRQHTHRTNAYIHTQVKS